ncbi:MAG: T9SS type A sorting domain-containing protein, partial [candidate division Zixibacteria bacterium]|nr:T9SS type A sorting domain-containing protein [candidate division Zixibacteria bacterium]
THLAVRNIQKTARSVATADLLVNNWYGRISQNTAWGPNKTYAITGDVTVDYGVTLTIQPGTTIKFQKNEDTQSSGGSTTKSELIVKGTLTCLGTLSDSIIFTSSAASPSNGDWGWVLVDSLGRANIEFTRFSYADTALAIRGDTSTVVMYNSTFANFSKAAVSSRSYKTRLGGIVPVPNPPDCGRNNFLMNTATSGAYAVIKSSSPVGTLKAEGNWWSQAPPQSSWFSGNVDRTPHLTGYATPDSCQIVGGFAEPPPEERVTAIRNLPIAFELGQNYPNPFNPTTTIQYALPEPAKVEIKIFNMLAQAVKTLVNEEKPAGYHQIVWDGKDEAGRAVSTGVYLYQIKAGEFVETKKMQLVK